MNIHEFAGPLYQFIYPFALEAEQARGTQMFDSAYNRFTGAWVEVSKVMEEAHQDAKRAARHS